VKFVTATKAAQPERRRYAANDGWEWRLGIAALYFGFRDFIYFPPVTVYHGSNEQDDVGILTLKMPLVNQL
jgi:hypothetical protein